MPYGPIPDKPEQHRLEVETDVSSWTKQRTVCSCGFVGPWRNPHEYVAPEHPTQ